MWRLINVTVRNFGVFVSCNIITFTFIFGKNKTIIITVIISLGNIKYTSFFTITDRYYVFLSMWIRRKKLPYNKRTWMPLVVYCSLLKDSPLRWLQACNNLDLKKYSKIEKKWMGPIYQNKGMFFTSFSLKYSLYWGVFKSDQLWVWTETQNPILKDT